MEAGYRMTDLASLLALPVVVVLDEAYVEFARGKQSRIAQVREYDNLIVLRTFSKLAGLAGFARGVWWFSGSFDAAPVEDKAAL